MEDKFDGIMLFDNVIEPELAQKLIDYLDSVESPLQERHGESTNVICDWVDISTEENAKEMDQQLFKVFGNIINQTYQKHGIVSKSDTGYCLRKIYGETRRHSDGVQGYGHKSNLKSISTDSLRNMSVIIALNDDYEDGVFNFPYQSKKLRLKKYQAVAFPPYWTHPHEVSAPKEGTYRYTINTWLCE